MFRKIISFFCQIYTIISNVFLHIFSKSSMRVGQFCDKTLRFWAILNKFSFFLSNLHYNLAHCSSVYLKTFHVSKLNFNKIFRYQIYPASVIICLFLEHGKGGGGGAGVKAEVVFTMRNLFFRVFFFLWLEFATKFTMLSCDLGVEARCGHRNSFPRRSPKFARAECTLAANPSPKNKKPKKRIFSDGKYHETLSKYKKIMDFLFYFWSKKSGEIMDFTLAHIIYKDNIYKNAGKWLIFECKFSIRALNPIGGGGHFHHSFILYM